MIKSSSQRIVKNYLPAILWAILIFIASSIPSNSMPKFTAKFSDLVIHFVVYAVFGVLLARAFVESPNHVNWKLFAVACFVGIFYAASDEFHQKFVQGRFSSFSDLLADSVGVLFGLSLFVWSPKVLKLLKPERLS